MAKIDIIITLSSYTPQGERFRTLVEETVQDEAEKLDNATAIGAHQVLQNTLAELGIQAEWFRGIRGDEVAVCGIVTPRWAAATMHQPSWAVITVVYQPDPEPELDEDNWF